MADEYNCWWPIDDQQILAKHTINKQREVQNGALFCRADSSRTESSIAIDGPLSRSTSRESCRKPMSNVEINSIKRRLEDHEKQLENLDPDVNLQERLLILEGMMPSILQRMEYVEYYSTGKIKDLARQIEKLRKKTNQIISYVKRKNCSPDSDQSLLAQLACLQQQVAKVDQRTRSLINPYSPSKPSLLSMTSVSSSHPGSVYNYNQQKKPTKSIITSSSNTTSNSISALAAAKAAVKSNSIDSRHVAGTTTDADSQIFENF